jgi:glycosyltransferase involved in cell wall biosynthesis
MKEKINILYINQTAKMSGAEHSLLSLIEKLDRERFNPIILLPENGILEKKAKELGIETIVFPYLIKFGEGYRPWKLPKILMAVLGIVKLIKRKNIDIVHSNSPRAGFLGGLCAKLSKVASVIHVRDIHLSPFSNSLKAFILDILSDKIIAVSGATMLSIIEKRTYLERKTRVIYNGIDLKKIDSITFKDIRKELGLSEEELVMGSIGIIHPAKGHETLLRSVPIVKEKFPSLKVLIIGESFIEKERRYKDFLLNLTIELGISNDVIFTGWREDVLDLLKAMDIFVLPSIYPEPFPRTLLEASALKKPIVATKVGGVMEIVKDGHTGVLVSPSNHYELASAIISLLENRDKAEELAVNARKFLEGNFTIEKHVREITNLYLELK